MKRLLGLVLVVLVFGVVGCAQIDEAKTKEAVMVLANQITVKIAANAPTSDPVPANPYIWAVGELGTAAGGTGAFWGQPYKLVGQYGTAHTVVGNDLSDTSGWGTSGVLDFKFVVTSGNTAPAGGCEINNGGGNFAISLVYPNVLMGVEMDTANPGVKFILE